MKTSQAIRDKISKHKAGVPFTPALFAGLGSRGAIDQTLQRLVQSGQIERVGHGLYLIPHVNRFGVKSSPPAELIAQMIAQSEGAIITTHGADAARLLGLTTQMPVHPVFYTTGSTRTLRLGKIHIKLQHIAPRKLILAGRPAGQALSALWYLGRHRVEPSTFQHIARKLPPDEFNALREAKASMPYWMLNTLNRYEKNETSYA